MLLEFMFEVFFFSFIFFQYLCLYVFFFFFFFFFFRENIFVVKFQKYFEVVRTSFLNTLWNQRLEHAEICNQIQSQSENCYDISPKLDKSALFAEISIYKEHRNKHY
eukprot:TRINITY_DN11012_c0_g1_i2.p4 TRINITY_DN11012_c0_g1~~TRINITY_DN11012_c0_g1_i2.p4  ORF type:complete len:107 (+),score=18.39 TRINITY_DN11012_c0_g1_i2:3-323(+)